MGFGNILADKQPQASAFGGRLGGEKRRKQLFLFNGGNASAVVLNLDFYCRFVKSGDDREFGVETGVSQGLFMH